VAKVIFSTALRKFTGGAESVEVDASNVRQLIIELDRRFPGIGAQLRAGTAVAVDGEIIQEALLEPIGPESEVHFLPSLGGG
jgi:sulfur-carrier protein